MNTRNACLLTVIHFQRKLTVKQISPIFTFASSLILNSLGALDALFWYLRKSAKLTNRIIRILRHFQPMKRLYYDTLLFLKVWLIFREIRINKHGKTLTRNRGSFFFQFKLRMIHSLTCRGSRLVKCFRVLCCWIVYRCLFRIVKHVSAFRFVIAYLIFAF